MLMMASAVAETVGVLTGEVKTLLSDAFGSSNTPNRRRVQTNAFAWITVVVTIVVQYLLQKYLFQCPNSGHYQYGMVFLLFPMVALYGASVILSRDISTSLQGFCSNCSFRKRRIKLRASYVVKVLCFSFSKCLLAPLTWLTMSLLQEDIYACAVAGPGQVSPGGNATRTEYAKMREAAESRSQELGFGLLVLGVSVTCICYVISECFNPQRLEPDNIQLEALDDYPAYEADGARVYFEDLMRKAAKVNGERKVHAFLGIKPAIEDLKIKVDGSEDLSYAQIVTAREAMLHVYPRLRNPLDEDLDWYLDGAWKVEEKKCVDPLVLLRTDSRIGINQDRALNVESFPLLRGIVTEVPETTYQSCERVPSSGITENKV